MNTEDIITMIHNELREAEAEIARTDIPDALRLMNTSYQLGRIYGLLELLDTEETLDTFVEIHDGITDRLHTIMKKEDEIYRRLR